jgi:predicted ATPase
MRLIGLLRPSSCSGVACRRAPISHSSMLWSRDAAYSTLLRRERQLLHARIAKVMTERFSDISETPPEILAHHYTEAGLVEPAVTHWRQAGERARRRWANVEAVKHFTRAIELLPALREGAERNRLEFGLNAALGDAMGEIRDTTRQKCRRCFLALRPSSMTARP